MQDDKAYYKGRVIVKNMTNYSFADVPKQPIHTEVLMDRPVREPKVVQPTPTPIDRPVRDVRKEMEDRRAKMMDKRNQMIEARKTTPLPPEVPK